MIHAKKLWVNLPIPGTYPELGNFQGDIVEAARNVEFGWAPCDGRPFSSDQKVLYGPGSALDHQALEAVIKLLAASLIVQRTVEGTPAFNQSCTNFMKQVKDIEHLESKLLEKNVFLSLYPKNGESYDWPQILSSSLCTVFQVRHRDQRAPGSLLEPPIWTTKVDTDFMGPSVGARLRRQYQTSGRDDGGVPFQSLPPMGGW